MSLLTRCPACETLYKLVPDQLRISQGWVKCGQCGEIFDASKHLIQLAIEAPRVPESPVNSVEADANSDVKLLDTPGAVFSVISDADVPGTQAASAPDSVAASAPAVATHRDAQVEVAPDIAPNAYERDLPVPATDAPADVIVSPPAGLATDEEALVRHPESLGSETMHNLLPDEASPRVAATLGADAIGVSSAQRDEGSAVVESMADTVPNLAQLESDQEHPQASFLGDSGRRSIWYQRKGQWILALAVFVLGAGLLFQGIFWERDRWAASYPALKPMLQQLCQPWNCSVQSLQRVDAMAVDAVAFNRVNAGGYRLRFVLKNLSPLSLALPNVELTLTDTQEQVLVRRVLSRHELFAAQQEFLPGAELPVVLFLRLELGEAAPRDMGYRVLAFYP